MLPLADLQRLAVAYQRERAHRACSPRASGVRDQLLKEQKALRQAAASIGDYTRHELALIGVTAAEVAIRANFPYKR